MTATHARTRPPSEVTLRNVVLSARPDAQELAFGDGGEPSSLLDPDALVKVRNQAASSRR